ATLRDSHTISLLFAAMDQSNMRIALVAPLVSPIAQPFVGGAQSMLANFAQGLLSWGHQVTLFAREGSFLPGVCIEAIPVLESVRPSDFSVPDQAHPTDHGFFAQANLFLELFPQLRLRH